MTTTVLKSVCRMCHGGCGVLVHVRDGEVVKLQGDPDSPLSQGRMCPKGRAGIEQLYHPDRLTYPMKRAGERGRGRWERISWDEALDTIAGKIEELRAAYGIESVAVGTGTGRHHFAHVIRFANALGTPNWCEPGTAQCFIPRIVTGAMTYGDLPICDYYGDVNPACVLAWGHNPVVSGPDGEIQFRVRDCLARGAKLIVVDPRRTAMAERADLWLQIRPGTDAALALGMLHVIVEEGLEDRAFVERWTVGFDQLAARLREYPPERVADITWVPADAIREAARLFARTKPAALEWGVALEHTPNCLQTVRAVGLLPALTGNVDVPGGWVLGMHLVPEPDLLAERLSDEMRRKRMGADRYRVLAGPEAFFPAAHAPTLFEAMRTGEPYPVKAFLVFGNNALTTYAQGDRVRDALLALDFLMVMDLYMTPTAELADLVLPAASWLEVDQVVPLPFIANNVVLAQQRAVRIGECRQDEEVFIDLARRLGLDAGTEPLADVLRTQLRPLGIDFAELAQRGSVTAPIRYRKHEDGGFRTPSGKVELASSYLEALGYDPLPSYVEPPESPMSTPELAEEFPLILTTGGRSQYFFHSEYRQLPSLRRRHHDPMVEIHPETAQRYGIGADDWVWIESPRGRIRQKARLTDGIDPRVVHVEHGWWFPEDKSPDHGVWRSNANLLTNGGPPYDPAMGTYQLRALLCRIGPVKDEEEESWA